MPLIESKNEQYKRAKVEAYQTKAKRGQGINLKGVYALSIAQFITLLLEFKSHKLSKTNS